MLRQLFFGQGAASLLPSACGLISGWLYASNLGDVQSWRLPGPVVRFARVFGFLVASAPPPALPRLPGARGGGVERDRDDGWGGGGGGAAAAHAEANAEAAFLRDTAPARPPSEDDIGALMAMGFDRDAVLAALAAAGNSVQIAADRLLTS